MKNTILAVIGVIGLLILISGIVRQALFGNDNSAIILHVTGWGLIISSCVARLELKK